MLLLRKNGQDRKIYTAIRKKAYKKPPCARFGNDCVADSIPPKQKAAKKETVQEPSGFMYDLESFLSSDS